MLFVAGNDLTSIFQIIHRSKKANWSCIQKLNTISASTRGAGTTIGSLNADDLFIATNESANLFSRWDITIPSAVVKSGSSITFSGQNLAVNSIFTTDKYAFLATNDVKNGQVKVLDVTANSSTTPALVYATTTANDIANTVAMDSNSNILLVGSGNTVYRYLVSTSTGVLTATGTLDLSANTITKIRMYNNGYAFVSTDDTTAGGGQIKLIKYNTGLSDEGYININAGAANDIWIKGSWLIVGTANNSGNNFYVYNISGTPSLPSAQMAAINVSQAAVNTVTAASAEPFAFAGVNTNGQSIRVISLCGLYYDASTTKNNNSLLPKDDCGLLQSSSDPKTIALDSITNTLDQDQSVDSVIVGSDFQVDNDYLFFASKSKKNQAYIYSQIPGAAGASNQYVSEGEYESRNINVSPAVNWNQISWTYDISPDTCPAASIPLTYVKFQLRTANDPTTLSTASYIGPDGTDSSFYTVPGTIINSAHNNTTYLQYKATLVSDSSCTPFLKTVTFNVTDLP